MKRLINYIKNLFNHQPKMAPAQFRELFEKAYPDAAGFVDKIKAADCKGRIYLLPFSICVDGAVAATKSLSAVPKPVLDGTIAEQSTGDLKSPLLDDFSEN